MMSAIGTKRTCRVALHMSAFGGKADMASASQNVCLWPKADIRPEADGYWPLLEAQGRLCTMKRVVIAALLLLLSFSAKAETPEEWIALGARVHGAFGAFIPLGIKIGLDATKRLNAKPRELTVLYYDNDTSPCACFADGIAIATYASVGSGR